MESEERRGQRLIVPMNLRDCRSVAVACSVAARDSGAFVPVGEIGSDTRPYDCLVTPARVFPLGRFAFSVRCVGRVGGDPNLRRWSPPQARGEGVVLSTSDSPASPSSKNSNVFSAFRDERFMESILETMELQKNPAMMDLVKKDKAGKVKFKPVPDEDAG